MHGKRETAVSSTFLKCSLGVFIQDQPRMDHRCFGTASGGQNLKRADGILRPHVGEDAEGSNQVKIEICHESDCFKHRRFCTI